MKRICLVLSLVLTFDLSGCAASNDRTLTPAEARVSARNTQFNNTLIEGAAIGLLTGAAIGALTGKNLQSAALGGLSGAVAGTGFAYAVANRTEAQQQTEKQYNDAIAQARQSAQNAAQDAQDAQAIAFKAQSDLRSLQARYAARQIDAAQYSQTISHYQNEVKAMQSLAAADKKQAQQMQTYASGRKNDATMSTIAAGTEQSAAQQTRAVDAIVATLSQVPASPPNMVGSAQNAA